MHSLSRHAALLAALTLPGCVAVPAHRALAQAAPRFEPIAFFLGRTHGEGRMRILRHAERAVTVDGVGRMDGETLVVEQHIQEDGRPPRDRRWLLRPAGAGRWTGTLTDAAGPVEVLAQGNALTIRYRMRGGLAVRQWIYLQPDGTALNRMAVFKLGMPVARLRETIVRAG